MFDNKEEAYEKIRVRMFWTHRWQYKRISYWEDAFKEILSKDIPYTREKRKLLNILFKDALIKMIFEKRLTRDEASSLFEMIKSNDIESISLALLIMKQKKRTIFLKK